MKGDIIMNGAAKKQEKSLSLMEHGRRVTEIGIVGIWLILLYPVLIWSVIGSVSAYGFQDKIKLILDKEGNPMTISAVIRHAILTDALEERENKVKIQISETETLEKEYRSKRVRKKEALDREEAEEKNIYLDILNRLKEIGENPEADESWTASDIFSVEKIILPVSDGRISDLWTKFLEAGIRVDRCKEEYYNARAEMLVAKTEKEHLYDNLSKIQDDLEDVMEKELLGNIVCELEYMRILGYKKFATMPSQVLTLLLTLFMVALGSLIYITRHYFRTQSEKPFSWYLFRPFLGMVTAFAVFILVKTGQITVSDMNAAKGAEENLNPFFISFFGIISGLLSEQAIERIRLTGISVFRTTETGEDGEDGEEQSRWAVGLRQAMDNQGRTEAELFPFVDCQIEIIEEWVAEKQQVPPEAQRIIAAWLNSPARSLFTDLAPAYMPEPQMEKNFPKPMVSQNKSETEGNDSESKMKAEKTEMENKEEILNS